MDDPIVPVIRKYAIIEHCRQCPERSSGFLSEPDECGAKGEVYEYFTPKNGIPEWCPLDDA